MCSFYVMVVRMVRTVAKQNLVIKPWAAILPIFFYCMVVSLNYLSSRCHLFGRKKWILFPHTTNATAHAPYMRLYILWKATINKQGSCSKKYRNFTYRQTYLYRQNYPLHWILLQDTGNQSFLKSSHSIVPEILKENRSEKRSDTYQNAQ